MGEAKLALNQQMMSRPISDQLRARTPGRDRMEFLGPVGHCPTIQIYTADGVGAEYTVLYSGNVLRVDLRLFRHWKSVYSIVANDFRDESPPLFWLKFPNAPALTNIN
jgi:hypothetical protein